MKLSVIICTYNREKYIYNALKSIAEQDFPKNEYKIILVNNNSTDKTEEICRRFQTAFPEVNFLYTFENNQGLSFARNKGIRESSGDIIIFLDDDATAFPDYLTEYSAFFQNNSDAIAAGGPIYPYFETKEPKWMSPIMKQLLGGYLYAGQKTKPFKNGQYPGGGNAAYRSEAFKKFGYFNTELGRKGTGLEGSEEKDMFDRFRLAGKPFYYLPKAAIYHYIPEVKLSQEYFKKLCYSIGVGERKRTLSVSKKKYSVRLLQELFKWAVTVCLLLAYTVILQPQKGWKLLQFRWHLTKGLLSKRDFD